MREICVRLIELADLDLDEAIMTDDHQAIIPERNGHRTILVDWSDEIELWSVCDEVESLASYYLPDDYENHRVQLAPDETEQLLAYLEQI